MLLLLAIVQSDDAPVLAAGLVEQQLRLTLISSSGGLFGAGNVALLMGVDEAQYPAVIDTIHKTCKTRTKYVSPWPAPEPAHVYFAPVEVEVGGAVVFGVPVERFVHLSGDPDTQSDTEKPAPVGAGSEGERRAMKLMVAIVRNEDTDDVIDALRAAGQRLTRINTQGGFLRRGNATLLIGVEAQEVDKVIGLIQSACRPRSEAAPLEKGNPEYSANVFVLDASHFVRI